jgi:signal transduction histidine kinase
MGLAKFIRENQEEIIDGWEAFARDYIPPASGLDPAALKDHIRDLLNFIVEDMRTQQNKSEQRQKSKGEGEKAGGENDSAAETHAEMRFLDNFEAYHIFAELRALRASITDLWDRARPHTDADYQEMIRFNETIDQIAAESLARYTDKQSKNHELFLGTLVHDLRNPIAATIQAAQVVMAYHKKQQAMLDQINLSSTHLDKMISDLIDVVRVRIGKGFPISPHHMDLRETVTNAVNEIKLAYPKSEIKTEVTGDVTGDWDDSRMAQVLSNLIGNAVQHGDTTAPIEVIVEGNSGEIELSVHNGGNPIPSKDIPNIFDPLTQGNYGRTTRKNLGLGLFISKQIIEAHGGDIEVSSSEAEGTTFVAHLPRHSAGSHAAT